MENKTNDFTIVTHKITSAIRENSLFHFVREQGSTVTCLSAYHLEESETETRHVLYFKPHTAITTESFRGAAPNNEHLSIDKFFSRENARYANGFGPAHWTVSYDDFRLHIYFSDNGDILNYHVKQDSNESDVELTPIEKKQIWAQAQPIQTMLQEIIKQKQQTYVQLQSELFEQERKLLRLTSKEQYYQQGQDYLAQVEKLNRYSDIVEVRQSLHINKLINRLEQNAELTVTPAEPSAPEATASIQEAITAPSTISQKPKKESKLAILKNQLREKADTLRLTATPYEQASLLAKIDDVALDILFESSSKNAKRTSKKFIETLKKQLPITLDTLTQQFQDKLKSGDVTYVLENYDSLSWQVNMRAMMDDFIKQLAEIPPSAAQLQIANYLYQNSQYYRSALFVKGISCTSCSWDKFSGEGLLVKCMRKQNLDAFKLFLEQGVSVNSYQMLYNAVAISALQAITLQSAGKEEALAVPYAKALLELGASISQASFHEPSAPKSTSLSVKEKKYQRFFMVGDALKLAIILGQCLLVKLFAAHVDVVTLQKEMEECHIGCYKNVRNVGETLAILQAEINQKESLKVPSISVFDQNTANEGENHSNSEINGVSP